MNYSLLRARRGFTLIEVLLSMTLMLVVIGLSTKMFQKQSSSVSTQTGRLDAQQNSRFAMSTLERELRVAGAGVADRQPLLVMAGPLGMTFNVNLVALDTGDLSAVYINPDADPGAAGLLLKENRITLPGTTKLYPDTNYELNVGVASHAETISYWIEHDSTSQKANEYSLYRRVNDQKPRLVVRGLIFNPAKDTMFRYYKTDTIGNLTEVPQAKLPIIHNAPIHGAQNDTGVSALTDSIKQVRVKFTSIFRDPRTPKDSVLRTQALTIHLMNAGLLHHATCGEKPEPPTAVTAVVTPADGVTITQTFVTISWAASIDEATGEKDIERYALFRRLATEPDFGEPFASIPGVPGGAAAYSFTDTNVESGQKWIYAVSSQDCTPQSSSTASAIAVVIP